MFTAGDNAYGGGSASDFRDAYQPTWGRLKGRTYPTPGNHDYLTPNASGYFDYLAIAPARAGSVTTPTTSGRGACLR